ncbi:MAG: hypothetical protein V1866_05680 [archaeon]
MNKSVKVGMGPFVVMISSDHDALMKRLSRTNHSFLAKGKPDLVVAVKQTSSGSKKLRLGKTTKKEYCHEQADKIMVKLLASESEYLKKECSLRISFNRRADLDYTYDEFLRILRFFFSYFLLRRGSGFLLHSSSVVVDRKRTLLFCGKSGSGKSFIAKHLTKSHRLKLMNDECNLLLPRGNAIYAYPTIFLGKEQNLPNNIGARVERIYFMRRGKDNRIIDRDKKHCFVELMKNTTLGMNTKDDRTLLMKKPLAMRRYLRTVSKAASTIEMHGLEWHPDSSDFYDEILNCSLKRS